MLNLEITEEPYKHSIDAMLQCFSPEGKYIAERVESLSGSLNPSEIINTLSAFITLYETDIFGIPSIQVFPLLILFPFPGEIHTL